MKFDITLYAELLIYTGYAWRNMTEAEKEILEPGRVLPEYPENPKAGDICDPTASFYGEGWEEKNRGIQQLAPFIFENMNFTERAEITAVMRRAMIRIADEYVNGAKENAE